MSAQSVIQKLIDITDKVVNQLAVLKKTNSEMEKKISSLETRIRSLENAVDYNMRPMQ